MEKLTQETVNFTEKNIDRIAALFPSVYFGLIVPLFSVKPCHYNS